MTKLRCEPGGAHLDTATEPFVETGKERQGWEALPTRTLEACATWRRHLACGFWRLPSRQLQVQWQEAQDVFRRNRP
jgi:hypothetical protein